MLWEPGRWWRVVYADGRRYADGRLAIWCETSNEQEARAAVGTCPGGGVLQRIFEHHESEWRTEEGD